MINHSKQLVTTWHEYTYGTAAYGEPAEPAYWTGYCKGALADLEIYQDRHYRISFFLINAKSMPWFEFCIPVIQVVMVIWNASD